MAEVVVLDAFEEILVRLDVEDVLRCKSVCKSWYSLISSDYFVKSHLKHAYNNYNPQLGHLRIKKGFAINKFMYGRTVGSSNGLVCISPKSAQFLVTNPCTREIKKLRTLPYTDRSKLCWGFGYDSCIDDYKVVVGINEYEHHMRFQVLTLKSNQWKFVREVNYDFSPHFGPGFLYNGALHWIMDDPNDRKKKAILSFDLCKERFKEIPQPDDKRYVCDYYHTLGMFEECLCIFRTRFVNKTTDSLQTWVMKKYNVKESWELLPCEKNKYAAATTAYRYYYISHNSWRFCDENGNVSLTQSWYNIGEPVFVKSLVSPFRYAGEPKKKNNKRSLKSIMSNGQGKKHKQNNKSKELIEGDPRPSARA